MGGSPGPALDLRLYLVTDPGLAAARGVVRTVELALAAGVSVVQLRDKQAGGATLLAQARELRTLCHAHAVPLLVNDRVDVALAAGADGVHLGQDDLPAAEARKLLGPSAIIGVSVRTPSDVARAVAAGASYVAANGIWATGTKTDFGEPLGLAGLAALVAASRLPVVAIGGIGAHNARQVAAAGAAGIAVVSAIMTAGDPAAACHALRSAFEGSGA